MTPEKALAAIRFHVEQAAHLPALDRAIIDALTRAPYRQPEDWLAGEIAARRADPEFADRLRRTVEESGDILGGLSG